MYVFVNNCKYTSFWLSKKKNTPVSEFLLVKNRIFKLHCRLFDLSYLEWCGLDGQPSLVWKLELCFVVVYLFQRSNFLRSPVICTNGKRPLCFCCVDWGVLWDGGLLSILGWLSAMWKRGLNWVRLVLDSYSMFRVVFFPMISPFWVRRSNHLACSILYSNVIRCIICKKYFVWNWWTLIYNL